MDLLDLTLPTIEENLALDEALLDELETADEPRPLLRFWEPDRPAVVVGRASHVEEEVDRAACDGLGIPVRRRASGGAAIVTGPGCLMYACILHTAQWPGVVAIDQAHKLVLGTIVSALSPLVDGVARHGFSDLARHGRKFSGNSLRVKRRSVLYHGTLLYDFPLDLVPKLLAFAPRQPEYRAGRNHRDFVDNLPSSRGELVAAIAAAWEARSPRAVWPEEATRKLVAEKYAQPDWNYSR